MSRFCQDTETRESFPSATTTPHVFCTEAAIYRDVTGRWPRGITLLYKDGKVLQGSRPRDVAAVRERERELPGLMLLLCQFDPRTCSSCFLADKARLTMFQHETIGFTAIIFKLELIPTNVQFVMIHIFYIKRILSRIPTEKSDNAP